ncbi:MAG: hypothetical protein ABI758_01580 [Candidatus Woesebacteria bacterium]
MKKIRSIRSITVLLWLLPVIFALFFSFGPWFVPASMTSAEMRTWWSPFLSLLLLFFLYIVGFLICVPYWIGLVVIHKIYEQKIGTEKSALYLAFVSEIIIVCMSVFLGTVCSFDYACSREGSVGDGFSLIHGVALCLLFCTYPFLSNSRDIPRKVAAKN